ncbi:MAG: hypothetical protein LBQ70_05070 [Prevotellaceae bacterium]|nr:hypothetical protein [Prevotellaceae bacterium]
MKLFNKLFMMALVLSVFVGCGKDDEQLPKETYKGTITVVGTLILSDTTSRVVVDTTIANVPITIEYNADKTKATLTIAAGTIPPIADPVKATCTVTSTADNYVLSGSTSVSVPILNMGAVSLTVTVSNSTIDKAGHAVLNMTGTGSIGEIPLLLTIGFDGQKQ